MSDQFQPENWKIGEWIALFGVVGGVAMFLWNKVFKPSWKVVNEWMNLAGNVSVIKQKQEEIGRLIIMARSRSYAVLDTQPHPIWESDGDGKCTFCNQAMLSVLGVAFESISGDSWRTIIHQDDREDVFREWDSAVREHRDFQMEYKWVGSGGKIIRVSSRSRRIMDGQNVIGFICNVKVLPDLNEK